MINFQPLNNLKIKSACFPGLVVTSPVCSASSIVTIFFVLFLLGRLLSCRSINTGSSHLSHHHQCQMPSHFYFHWLLCKSSSFSGSSALISEMHNSIHHTSNQIITDFNQKCDIIRQKEIMQNQQQYSTPQPMRHHIVKVRKEKIA